MNKNVILSILLLVLATSLSLFMQWDSLGAKTEMVLSETLTLQELARQNAVPVKEILHILSHENLQVWDLPKDVPVAELDFDFKKIKSTIEHIKAEEKPVVEIVKYVLWAVWISLVVLLVMSRKKIRKIRVPLLIITLVAFGLLLGATPNPMESVVKLFKMLNKMEGEPKVLITSMLLFTLFSIYGSKLICSWGCQLGALQESIFNIPLFKRKRRIQVPFTLSITLRLVLFVLFLFLLFGIIFGVKNFVLFHHINYFKIYSLDLAVFALYLLPLFVITSLLLYRPFCQFVCPFGLYSWFLENVAINRIKINQDRCIKCKACVKNCPTQAMKGIYEERRKVFLPDCWSCGVCTEVCPTNAIRYGFNQELPAVPKHKNP
jgi:formate hydrogenlyase subunit 6/NADH:ubiquinone oxidoreductase subunit I